MAAGDVSKVMKATVRSRIGDLAGTTWTDDEIYAHLNAAQYALAQNLCDAALWQLTKADSTTLAGAQDNYDLPSDFLRERLVKYKGIVARRWPVEELDALRANPQTAPSETNPFYYIWVNDVVFDVSAVTQGNGDEMEIWYIAEPTEMDDDTDPDLGTQFHNIIEDRAVALCLEHGQGEWDEAKEQTAHFLEQCILINSRYAGKPAYDGVPNDPRLEVLLQEARD